MPGEDKRGDPKSADRAQAIGAAISSAFAAPSISLPKGGGAIRGMGEKFAANPVTGTGSMSVPISTSPVRSGFGPKLSLSYDSGWSNGALGFCCSLSIRAIARETNKSLPQYDDAGESDVYVLLDPEDRVPVLESDRRRYEDDVNAPGFTILRHRPRVEGVTVEHARTVAKSMAPRAMRCDGAA